MKRYRSSYVPENVFCSLHRVWMKTDQTDVGKRSVDNHESGEDGVDNHRSLGWTERWRERGRRGEEGPNPPVLDVTIVGKSNFSFEILGSQPQDKKHATTAFEILAFGETDDA
eukprot:TRINITY_DN8815_c0_g1_i2.p2 TRINITY_DN8815_c0_g1~~TRINITY_DN8815_c0_g1_i2.p2  ORF type:complete len:113 (-),score=29.20 TRINITY_DN8815_c0_g1_i2:719-1057(-)